MNNANYFDYDDYEWNDDLAAEDRRERFWASGQWKPVLLGLMGLATVAAALAVPRQDAVYANWLIGAVAGNVAVLMSGNRKWERPLAATAGIWLFVSGFVQPLYASGAWRQSDLLVGVALVIASGCAFLHLRGDLASHRPHTL